MQPYASFWEDVPDENGLEIGNKSRATHHRTRERQEGELVINLMLAHQPPTTWFILADNHSTRSDNEVIEWEVDIHKQEADHERLVWWNIAAMMEENMEKAEKLWMEVPKERAHLDAEYIAEKVEQDAAWYQEAISNVLDTTAMRIGLCTKSTRRWNATIREKERRADERHGGDRTSNMLPG